MYTTTNTRTDRETRQFIVERVFPAPRALVFAAFTQAKHLIHWWGPKGWNLTACNMDFRVGGIWHYCMTGPNGEESWGKAVYETINEPENFTYMDYFSDAAGNIAEGMPGMNIRMEFIELPDGKTQILSSTQFDSVEDIEKVLTMGMVEGLTETWDRLEDYVGSETIQQPTVTISRLLDAPRPLV